MIRLDERGKQCPLPVIEANGPGGSGAGGSSRGGRG